MQAIHTDVWTESLGVIVAHAGALVSPRGSPPRLLDVRRGRPMTEMGSVECRPQDPNSLCRPDKPKYLMEETSVRWETRRVW